MAPTKYELPPAPMTLRKAMYILQDGRCPYCGATMIFTHKQIGNIKPKSRRKRVATEEHLVPRSANGDNSFTNRMLVCFECNQARDVGPLYIGMFAVSGR